MKRIRYYIFTLLCMFFFPLITHAECDYQRMAELNKIASNVQFSYSYDQELNFEVLVTNMTDEIYATDNYSNVFSGNGEHVFAFQHGSSIQYDIFSNDPSCIGEKLVSKYLVLPSYNFYHSTSACKEYPEFKYCRLWMDNSISVVEFENALTTYISQNSAMSEVKKDKDEGILFSKMYYFVLFFGIIFFIVSILLVRKRLRGRL